MPQIGSRIEPNPNGLYDLTVTDGDRPIRIERGVSLLRAAEIIEEESHEQTAAPSQF